MTRSSIRQNGAVIRRLRRERSIRTGDLAKRLGVHPDYLSHVEGGRHQASWELLHGIAGPDALDVPVDRLLTDAGRAELAEVTP